MASTNIYNNKTVNNPQKQIEITREINSNSGEISSSSDDSSSIILN